MTVLSKQPRPRLVAAVWRHAGGRGRGRGRWGVRGRGEDGTEAEFPST